MPNPSARLLTKALIALAANPQILHALSPHLRALQKGLPLSYTPENWLNLFF